MDSAAGYEQANFLVTVYGLGREGKMDYLLQQAVIVWVRGLAGQKTPKN